MANKKKPSLDSSQTFASYTKSKDREELEVLYKNPLRFMLGLKTGAGDDIINQLTKQTIRTCPFKIRSTPRGDGKYIETNN